MNVTADVDRSVATGGEISGALQSQVRPSRRFLVPMAISLGFGVLFVTVIALVLVPAAYLILEDIKQGLRTLLHRAPSRREHAPAESRS